MDIRGIAAGVVVGLIVGGGTLGASQAAEVPPDLKCQTVEACQVVLDVVYSDAETLGAETLDLRAIRDKQDSMIDAQGRTIEQQEREIRQLQARVERLRDRLERRR